MERPTTSTSIPPPAAASWDPSTALTITPDGIVTVHITKAEMGQGVGTALAQIVAEELEAEQLVAVVATSYEAAVKARDALKVTWDPGPNANVTTDSIFASFAKAKDDPGAAA